MEDCLPTHSRPSPLAHTTSTAGNLIPRKPRSPTSRVSYPPSGTSSPPGANAESLVLLRLVAGIPSPSDPPHPAESSQSSGSSLTALPPGPFCKHTPAARALSPPDASSIWCVLRHVLAFYDFDPTAISPLILSLQVLLKTPRGGTTWILLVFSPPQSLH